MKKYKLIEYYIRSYKDDYLKKTIEYKNPINNNKNAIDDNDNENENENENENPIDEYEIERRDEDVEDHYKYMFINPPRKAEIDYDDIDRIYELKLEEEERLKDREKEILLENEYEDNYDNYDINENYEDYEYNTDDDYYEINEEYY
jgi:guanylate kinase